MSHSTVILLFSAMCPWLMLVLGLQVLLDRCGLKTRGWGRLLLSGVLAAGFLLLPVQGMSVAGWVRGVTANFSIPFTALLAVAVWEAEFRRKWFTKADWTAAWAFGLVTGLGCYPLALGWGSFDPYEWGWSFSPLFVAGAVLTALLLWKQNRFGLLLLLAIAAYHLHLLESVNYWDYLLDPVYCLGLDRSAGLASLHPSTTGFFMLGLLADARQVPGASTSNSFRNRCSNTLPLIISMICLEVWRLPRSRRWPMTLPPAGPASLIGNRTAHKG